MSKLQKHWGGILAILLPMIDKLLVFLKPSLLQYQATHQTGLSIVAMIVGLALFYAQSPLEKGTGKVSE